MTRFTKTSLFAALGMSTVLAGAADVVACGRGGGGYGGGYGGYRISRPIYSQPTYPQQVYPQSVQPVQQQQFGQQQFGQQQFGQQQQQSFGQQPVQQQSFGQQPAQQQSFGQQPAQQQSFGQQPAQQQSFGQQPAQQQSVAQQPVQQQSVQQQSVQQQPVQTAQNAPATQVQPQTIQPQAAQPQSAGEAQQTALEMLSNFGGVDTPEAPAAQSQPEPQGFSGIGTWSATLANGATVQLDMRADGSFTWTAMKNGKQSTFGGTFTLNGESLTLNRQDNQQLSGVLQSAGTNGFTFKLNGVKDNGLQFARS